MRNTNGGIIVKKKIQDGKYLEPEDEFAEEGETVWVQDDMTESAPQGGAPRAEKTPEGARPVPPDDEDDDEDDEDDEEEDGLAAEPQHRQEPLQYGQSAADRDGEAERAEQAAQAAEQKAALDKAKAEAEEYKRKWYSVTAEYENYRKRTAAARTQAYTDGRKDVVVKLFPIADNLERALAACADEKTRSGIEMVMKAFGRLLEGEHITVISPVGEPFDAGRCEAILAVDPKEGEESGIVKEVYAKGYEQNGKILRFAQVLVTK